MIAIAAVVLAALPTLFASLAAPSGARYLGHTYNVDDHMVYAAWMRQAMDGRFLFDNRFTTDAQPGLTIHLYFLVVGWVAKITGIAFAANLARLAFSFLFVLLLYRFVRKLNWDVYATKLGLALPLLGAGVGFLVWHTFGIAFATPGEQAGLLQRWMLSRLPTDIWQPEIYVYPSMLTNGLFMASLCLMFVALLSFLEARQSARAVIPGALAMLVLMNIHSYDVLLIALVMIGFLTATLAQRQVTGGWVFRALLIGLGAVPAALWFMHVLNNDPVFQARAATETYSPNFRAIFFGLLVPIVLAFVGLAMRGSENRAQQLRRYAGLSLAAMVIGTMYFGALLHLQGGYFMSLPVWLFTFVVAVIAVTLLSDREPALNMMIAWALIGTVAVYYPALFQRKLAMGLAIPWCILAALGLAALLRGQERSARNLATAMVILLIGASSVRWAFRDLELSRGNISNTSLHTTYLNANMQRILARLDSETGRKVVLAPPGVPAQPFQEGKQEQVRAEDLTPIIPDLNPIVSGLTGSYTYAGHWSETPRYNERRGELIQLFLIDTPAERRAELLERMGARYVIAPVPESLPDVPLFDFRQLGRILVDGAQFRLIELRQTGE
jgi:hypothetical protein